jgi:hypothetical protein
LNDHLEDDTCELQQKIKMLDQIEDDVYELQPDGGWGWIVVFSGFLCVFMIDGVGYSFGILLPYLMEDFENHTCRSQFGLTFSCFVVTHMWRPQLWPDNSSKC